MSSRGGDFLNQALFVDQHVWHHGRLAKLLSEFIGTYFLVLTIGCSVLTASLGAALAIGGVIMVMVYALGSVSGAHFNPAVTTAVWLSARGLLTAKDALLYMVAQLLGGAAAGLTYLMLNGGNSFVFHPVGANSIYAAMLVEVVYSSALCYIVLNVATTRKQEGNHYFGLAIGFTVTAAAISIGEISGCCLNPAVCFGASLANAAGQGLHSLDLATTMLYFFAPLAGAGLACIGFYAAQREDEYVS